MTEQERIGRLTIERGKNGAGVSYAEAERIELFQTDDDKMFIGMARGDTRIGDCLTLEEAQSVLRAMANIIDAICASRWPVASDPQDDANVETG